MSVGGGGGGYSGGGGGFSGGFAPPPMFGGGFGQQFPSYGGGFGAFGPQPYSGFGGGFGGGFGMPQQPQYGGGFGGGFGQPQQPQFGGGFGQFQPPQFGGGFDQRGPGNAYARPFPGLQPQPARLPPPTQPTPPPPPGMEANPDYIPFGQLGPAVGDTSSPFRPIQRSNPATGVMPSEPIPAPNNKPTFSTMALVPATKDGVSGYYTDGSMRNFVPNTPTGGGYPSRDQFNQTFQLMPAVERPIQAERAVMPEVPTGGGYPSRDQVAGQPMPPTMIEPEPQTGTVRPAVMPSYEELGISGLLGGGLGGLYGGYQAMPYGGYQPMGGYRMFQF